MLMLSHASCSERAGTISKGGGPCADAVAAAIK
jgi:hypothetical protein